MKDPEEADRLEPLRALIRELEQEHGRLQAELALKAGVEAQLQEALLELAGLKRQLFGERSDQLSPQETCPLSPSHGAVEPDSTLK